MRHRQRRIGQEMACHLVTRFVDKVAKFDVFSFHSSREGSRLEMQEFAYGLERTSPCQDQGAQKPAKPRLEAVATSSLERLDALLDEISDQRIGVLNRLRQSVG